MGSYDAIIIGGGPGGYLAAERLGAARKKVLLVEKAALGGTCLNVGCIPTKTLVNSAKIYVHAREGERYGVKSAGVTFDWGAMQAWKREVVEKLRGGSRPPSGGWASRWPRARAGSSARAGSRCAAPRERCRYTRRRP